MTRRPAIRQRLRLRDEAMRVVLRDARHAAGWELDGAIRSRRARLLHALRQDFLSSCSLPRAMPIPQRHERAEGAARSRARPGCRDVRSTVRPSAVRAPCRAARALVACLSRLLKLSGCYCGLQWARRTRRRSVDPHRRLRPHIIAECLAGGPARAARFSRSTFSPHRSRRLRLCCPPWPAQLHSSATPLTGRPQWSCRCIAATVRSARTTPSTTSASAPSSTRAAPS